MTIQEKRIKIAKACGWSEIQWSELINPRIAIEKRQFCQDTEEFRCLWVPDYFNDLNTMHDAEKVLDNNEDLRGRYRFYLLEMLEVKTGADGWRIYRATASQRAEAFGLALGLWTAND